MLAWLMLGLWREQGPSVGRCCSGRLLRQLSPAHKAKQAALRGGGGVRPHIQLGTAMGGGMGLCSGRQWHELGALAWPLVGTQH